MPDKPKDLIAISFRLQKINTLQFAIIEETPPPPGEVHISAQLQFGCQTESKLIHCNFQYSIVNDEKLHLKLEVSCEFKLKNNSWETLINSGTLKLPVDIARHLGVITVGTSRGVLHAKTENTSYSHLPLPLINLVEIIKEDAIIEL